MIVPGPDRIRWLALSGVALLMGITLSWLTYMHSEAVLDVARPLIDRDLPTLRVIAELKSAASASERIASELYDSSDHDRFRARSVEVGRGTAPRLQHLRAAIDDPDGRAQVDAIENLQRDAERLLAALDRDLDSSRVDIGEVRARLGRIAANSARLNDRLDVLASGIQAQAEERGEATQARLRDIIVLVAVFSALLVVATVVVGYFFSAYLREAGERRRLALFPERNPNPVISLDANGAVAYANPGAMAMAATLGLASSDALLPDDLGGRLQELRRSRGERLRWEYVVGARIIGISIHRLEDLGAFHLYLSDVTERKQAEAQLEFQAFHDVLTGLPNRRRFQDLLADATRRGDRGAILLLSVDRMPTIVNTLGHMAADRIVRQIAERLATLAGGDQAACCIHRFDGELFAALLPRTAADEATAFAARVEREMAAPVVIDGREMFFSFSIGIAAFPDDGGGVGDLLRNADTALQQAKRTGGRSAVRYRATMNARALERLEVEHELRRAVERGELELHYQPQVDIASGRITGVEALVRWRHPVKGMISPADFIPIAEETGAIGAIGNWVLNTACAQNRQWQEGGLPPLVMAVNISPRQFADPGLRQEVLQALRNNRLAPEWLELEITEGAAMQDVDAAIATLQAFKSIGVRLSIDDFGTGYSSLAYLKRFPIDKLKIDQSFVRNLTDDANDAAIARSVITLGHSLGLTVIAEGVESEAHLRLLGAYGCEEYQGYLFSRPKPAADLRVMLDDQRAASTQTA